MKIRSFGVVGPGLMLMLMLGLSGMGTIPCARADIYIIESTAPGLKAGSQLSDSESLSVPAGTHVRALLPSGKTQTVKGPFTGGIADIGKGQLNSAGMIAWLRTFLQTGGANEATPGVTRSYTASPARPASFSWTVIGTGQDSIMCVPRDQALHLKRALTAKSDSITIVDRETSARGEAGWAAGSDSAAWPGTVAIRSGASYDLLIPDRPKRTVTLRVLAQVPDEADILSELHAQGCKVQFDAWLRETSLQQRR